MGTPIDRLSGLTPEHVGRLCDQWITTVEQLASLAVHKQFRPFLSERLGLEYDQLAGLLRKFYDDGSLGRRAAGEDVSLGSRPFYDDGSLGYRSFYDDGSLGSAPGPHQRGKFGMGLRLSPVTVRSVAAKDPYARPALTRPLGAAGLPEALNLAGQMPPVRDQGERGTCLAFSTCAVREFLAPDRPDLSEQFFYWVCKSGDSVTGGGEGSTIPMAVQTLAQAGVCLEATCPYDPNVCEPEEGPAPSEAAFKEARRYTWEAGRQIFCRLDDLKRILTGDGGAPPQPVVIGVMVFDSSFFSPDVFLTGRITIPFRGEACTGGHALCVVGYQDDAAIPGGGYLIIRNSWGTRWATRGAYGAGYGLMPYAYLALYGIDAMTLAAAEASCRSLAEGEKGPGAPVQEETGVAESAGAPSLTKPWWNGYFWETRAPAGAAESGGAESAGSPSLAKPWWNGYFWEMRASAGAAALHGDPNEDQHLHQGAAAGADAEPTGQHPTYVCPACGQTYASRFSMVRGCEVCNAMICQTCARLKDRTRCREHEEV